MQLYRGLHRRIESRTEKMDFRCSLSEADHLVLLHFPFPLRSRATHGAGAWDMNPVEDRAEFTCPSTPSFWRPSSRVAGCSLSP